MVQYRWREGVKPPDKVIEISEQHKLGQTLPIAEANVLAKEIYKYHAEQAWALNTAGLLPSPAIIKNAMQNVPANVPVFWPLRTPNNGYPEVWFYSN